MRPTRLTFCTKPVWNLRPARRKLLSPCRNFPLEILFVRDDDIPLYVMGGTADLGIIGQNVVWETEATVETVQVLPFGYCKLAVAVLKESPYQTVQDLQHKTIATSYPHTVQRYFAARQIEVNTVEIAGSVELTPTLGVSDAIVDIVSSGSTLVLNDLRMVEVMAESQACLIGNRDLATNREKAATLERLLVRLKGVLAAKEYKYVIMNVRETDVPKIIEVMPGLKSPSISKLGIADWVSLHSVIKENEFWETVERLKQAGACDIIVLPIEKIIR